MLVLLLLLGVGAGIYSLRKPPLPFARLSLSPEGPPALLFEGAPPLRLAFAEGCDEPFLESQGSWLSLEWNSYGRTVGRSLAFQEGRLQIPGAFERCDPFAGDHAILLLPNGEARFVPLDLPIRIRSWMGRVGEKKITLWTYVGQSSGLSGLEEFSSVTLLVDGLPRGGSSQTSIEGEVGGKEAWILSESVAAETIKLELDPTTKLAAVKLTLGSLALKGELTLTFEEAWKVSEAAPTVAPTTTASY